MTAVTPVVTAVAEIAATAITTAAVTGSGHTSSSMRSSTNDGMIYKSVNSRN